MSSINKPSQPLVPAEIDPAVLDSKADLVNGEVPSDQLPSYVDDVLEFEFADAFPEEGETGKIYLALDSNLTYRWSGAAYIQVGGASLAAGDGINIDNDVVSADLPYLNENLDFADTDYVDQKISILSGAIQHFGSGFHSAGSDPEGYAAFDVSLESITPEIEPIIEGEGMSGTLSADDVQTLRDMPGQINIKAPGTDLLLLATFSHVADEGNHIICYSLPVAKHDNLSPNPSAPQFTFKLDRAEWELEDTELATAAALASTNSTLSQVTEDMALAVQQLNRDVAANIEVVAYQTQAPLSAEQLAKAEAGKLAIYKDNFVYTKFTQDGNVVSFQAIEHMSENGTYTPGYNVRIRRYTLTLDRSTRMLNDAGYQQGVSVADTSANFLDAGTAPASDGKKLIREANLAEGLAAKADAVFATSNDIDALFAVN